MKTMYKYRFEYLVVVFFIMITGRESFAQIGINTISPDPSSILDIDSSDKGLLIPRVSISDLGSISPITGGSSEGLLVYNTNATTGKGFLFWTGTSWQSISGGWKTSGNSETDDTCNFIGTTNDNDLVFKTNDIENMRLSSSTQQLVIGTINNVGENDLLQVLGDIEIGGGATNYDSVSENIQITGQSQSWNINVKNSSVSTLSSNFYIGPTESANDAAIMISPNGYVKVGKSGDVSPLSELHIVNDQPNKTTSMRLDNTYATIDRPHTSYELWDGNTYLKGFFRHNNYSNVLDIGHDQGNGTFNFYAGNGTTSTNPSAIAMTIDSAGDLNVVNNLNVAGNLDVTGTISKGGGTFKIDHPLDPTNKYLYHSFVESPDMMNIYNGIYHYRCYGPSGCNHAQLFFGLEY